MQAGERADRFAIYGEVLGVCLDRDEDKFVASAPEARADCIETGDSELPDLARYQGVGNHIPHGSLERLR